MKYLHLWLLAIFGLSLTSCLNIIEEINLKEDGSGSYQITFDLNGLYHVSSFEAIMQDLTWGESYGFQDRYVRIDTVIPFGELIVNNREDFARPEFWEKVSMHTKFDMDQNVLFFEIKMDFDDLSDIDYFYQDFTKIKSANNSPEMAGLNSIEPIRLMGEKLFELEKNTLIRFPIKPKNEKIDQDQMQFLKQFIPNSTYKTIYHLPGKVKKSTVKNGIITGNTLIAEYPLLDIYEGETNLDGEIKFK